MHWITDLKTIKPLLPSVIKVNYDHMFYSWTMWLVNLNYTRRSRKLICKWEENCSIAKLLVLNFSSLMQSYIYCCSSTRSLYQRLTWYNFFANHLEFLRFGISYVNWFEHGLHSLWNSIISYTDMIIFCPHWLWYANWCFILIREWVSIVIKVSIFAA